MKPKTILTLLAVAVVAVLVAFALASASKTRLKAEIPEKPFEKVQINDSASVSVRDASGSVQLKKSGELWTVTERAGYPADFSKLSAFLNELADLKPAQAIPGGEEALSRFELLPADSKDAKATGLDIQVASKDGASLIALRRGKAAKQAELSDEERQMAAMMGRNPFDNGPRFAFLPASKAVVVIPSALSSASVKPAAWLDKDFPKPSGQIKSVALFEAGKPLWKIKRDEPHAEWSFEGKAPEKQDFDLAGASAVSNAASWLSFADVAGRAAEKPEHGLAAPKTVEIQDFDGMTLKFNVGEADKSGNSYVMASVSFAAPARQASKDEKPEDAKKANEDFAKRVEANKAKADKWAKRVDGWIYLVDKGSLEPLLGDVSKLFKPKFESSAKMPANALPQGQSLQIPGMPGMMMPPGAKIELAPPAK